MLNLFSFIGICLNSTVYSSSFFFSKLPKAYAFLNLIVDIMPVIPLFFFLLAFVWQAAAPLVYIKKKINENFYYKRIYDNSFRERASLLGAKLGYVMDD
ncbi:hypothetical protein H5410_014917, partial [Solanum commersonii]